MTSAIQTLADLTKHAPHRVTSFYCPDADTETRLREIGFAEGDEVEVLHKGLFGGTPLAIRLNGALIAMRRIEAGYIQVEAL